MFILTPLALSLALGLTADCRYGPPNICADWRVPLPFTEYRALNADGTVARTESTLLCVGNGSLHNPRNSTVPLGPFDSPAVMAWRCPDSTAPTPTRMRAVAHAELQKE